MILSVPENQGRASPFEVGMSLGRWANLLARDSGTDAAVSVPLTAAPNPEVG